MKRAITLTLALTAATVSAQLPPPHTPVAPQPGAAMPAAPVPLPPEWLGLPQIRYLRPLPSMASLSGYVRSEVEAGRCAAVARSASSGVVRVDLAVLVTSDSRIRRIVPRAINCLNVEQYASGLVSRMARDNIDNLGVEKDTWFRTSLIFAWPI
jgi:hypothetical protein